jgi:hypothetical protein
MLIGDGLRNNKKMDYMEALLMESKFGVEMCLKLYEQ